MNFLLDLTFDELDEIVKNAGEAAYRTAQIYSWIAKGAKYSQMSNVPSALKDKLAAEYGDEPIKIIKTLRSSADGTEKFLYSLYDGNVIEGVLMRYKYGNTLCVSTQVERETLRFEMLNPRASETFCKNLTVLS